MCEDEGGQSMQTDCRPIYFFKYAKSLHVCCMVWSKLLIWVRQSH